MKNMNIYEQLSKIQTSLVAPKSQENKFGGYKYRSCEDILNALKPHLADCGGIVTVSDEMVLVGDRVYVKATAIFAIGDASVSVSGYAREAQSRKGMDDSQITGATSSYARKYVLNGLFAIDDTRDADAHNKHEPEADPAIVKMVSDIRVAYEAQDWAALQVLHYDERIKDAWSEFDSKERSAIKKMIKQSGVVKTMLESGETEDGQPVDLFEAWEELTKTEKAAVWPLLNEETKETIKQLKEAA